MNEQPTITVRRSDALGKLTDALVKAQAEMRNPPKDSVNPHFKSRYADLATVRDAILPVLNRHGLAVLQLPCEIGDAAALTTVLSHTSGEWVETTMRLRPVKGDPQSVGSALTYARRYTLQSLAGVAAEDDDDGGAAGRTPARVPAARPAAKPPGPPKQTPGPHVKLFAEFAADLGKTEQGVVDHQLAQPGELEKAVLVALRLPSLSALADPDQIGRAREAMTGFVRARLTEEIDHQMQRLEIISWDDAFQAVRQAAVRPEKASNKQLLDLALALREEEMQPVGA
jgi:hypothetical protein